MRDLGVTINHLLRYGYCGILPILIWALIRPMEVERALRIVGGGGSLIWAIPLGAAIYALYRASIGDAFLYNIHDRLHRNNDRCSVQELANRGVDYARGRNAFRLIRNTNFEPSVAQSFEVQHSEIHLLYFTATAFFLIDMVFLGRLLICPPGDSARALSFGIVWIVSLPAALFADTRLCEREFEYMLGLGDQVNATLRRAGFLPPLPPGGPPLPTGAGSG